MERLENVMLSLENVTYRYENSITDAIHSVSFNLKKGEIIGLLGHNGAGKSTLLECISRLKVPASGDIATDDAENSAISFVPNDLYLYNMLTVKETLHFVGGLHSLTSEEINNIITPLMQAFSLMEKENEYMKNLSYGMKQQVALIIGILPSPNYLLLDEPMNGFDAITTKKTKEFLIGYSRENNVGIILSSHRLDIVEDICDKVVVINKGQLLYIGSVEHLKNNLSFEEALLSVTGDKK